jgi:recombination protein RecA
MADKDHKERDSARNAATSNTSPASTTANTATKEADRERVERQKVLEMTLSQIEKQFGKGSIMRLGQDTKLDIPAISTGSLGLDLALGIGGLPRGRIVEVFGPESSGKTTLTLSVIVEAQRAGGAAAFIDAEHALDPSYARMMGVNLDDLLVSQPDTGEQALEIAEMLVRSNAVDLVVIDSVAALVPKAEIEGEMGDQFMGLQARLMSQAMRKLTAAIAKSKTCCVFINQIREKIGVMFGNPETTPGGRALKFYSSVRVDLRRIDSIKIGDRIVGNRVRAKVVKNKVAPPFRQAEFDILFDEGISRAGSVLDVGESMGVIERQGSWLSVGGTKLGQGREAARMFLRENPKMMRDLDQRLRAMEAKAEPTKNGAPAEKLEEAEV